MDRSKSPVTDGEATAPTGRAACTATVLVPAHNEAAVIGRCLRILLSDAYPGELDVVVVNNGSSDDTGARAQSAGDRAGHPVNVLELPEPGKVAALRVGLAHVRHWPVIVLDADCELPTATARALAAALDTDVPAVASAHMTVTTEESAPLVRRFYRTWTALPYVRDGMVGSGVFALNETGYSRLGALPDVTNDDGWVRRSFAPAERLVVAEAFVAHAARTTRALVSRRARIVNGNRELDVDMGADPGRNSAGGLATSVRRGRVRPADAAAFLLVTAASRWVAAVRRLRGDRRWGTDTTSRVLA